MEENNMAREFKKYKIAAEGKEVMRQHGVLIIGLDQQANQVQLNIQGKIAFEEVLDMLNTAQSELVNTFYAAASRNPELDAKKIKKEIYERAVMGFSLMIDKFYPEGKDNKFHNFTNEAIMEAQNAKLKRSIAKKKES